MIKTLKTLNLTVLAAGCLALGISIKTYASQLPYMSTSLYTGPDGQSHYQQRIAEIQLERPINSGLMFIGDSLTEGCDWSELTARRTPVRNHGIGWDTSEGVVSRLPLILQNAPDHIFIMIGTNDLGYGRPPSETLRNISTALNAIRAARPQTLISVQAVLPREPAMWPTIDRFNLSLSSAIGARRDHKVSYLDHTSLFISRSHSLNPNLSYDGVHLNASGCQLWIDQIRKSL